MRRDQELIELRSEMMDVGDWMGLYESCCAATEKRDKRKRCWTSGEKDDGRDEIRDGLYATIRSHYEPLEPIAEDVERLGYKVEPPEKPVGVSVDHAGPCSSERSSAR